MNRCDKPVLVVDDDEGIRSSLQRALEYEGKSVITAENGREALDRLISEEPCLILLDLMMPQMDGWEFLQRHKKNPKIGAIPVVVISALDRKREKIDVDGYLEKPIDLERLLGMVEKYCSHDEETGPE